MWTTTREGTNNIAKNRIKGREQKIKITKEENEK